jgi:squalene-associated FAD-dependent desaturase
MDENKSPVRKPENTKFCVIGGGIAGLSAAVFLKDNGFDVTLIESSPRLGGRAYSFFDKDLNGLADNGVHILASWYESTFEFLKIIGTYDKLKFQEQLEVNFADLNTKQYRFKCPKLPPPLHLIWGLWSYKPLGFKDKGGITRLLIAVMLEKYTEEELKKMDTSELFKLTKQSVRVIDYFWKPFIVAVFNAKPENTSAWQFIQIIKTGFLRSGGSNLVFPKSNLNDLYVYASENYLSGRKAKVLKSTKIKKINYGNEKIESLMLEGTNELKSDYYISAVPFFEFKNLFNENVLNGMYDKIDNLNPSPILNIHFGLKTDDLDKIMPDDFVGIVNATVQWVFKISNNRICLVISSADEFIDKDKNEIIELCKSELLKCLPEFKNVEFISSKVIKEKRATFLPDTASVSSRPGFKTKYKNLFLAGDWIDTGYPATIESAVKSAKLCADEIYKLFS